MKRIIKKKITINFLCKNCSCEFVSDEYTQENHEGISLPNTMVYIPSKQIAIEKCPKCLTEVRETIKR